MNYDGYRAMFEAWNMLLGAVSPNVRSSGVLIWMSNSSWPSNVWQTYDSYLDCTGAYYGVQNACEPVHVQASFGTSDNNYYLDVVNNTFSTVNGTASCDVWNMNAAGIAKAGTQTSSVTAFGPLAKTYTNLQISNAASSTAGYFMSCVLKDGTGKVISRNAYARGKGNDWSQLKNLKTLTKLTVGTDLTITTIGNNGSGSASTLAATVANVSADKVGYMIHLALLKHGVSENGYGSGYVDPRVLPVYFNTNYFSLFPGESQTVTMEYDNKNLAPGTGADIEVSGVTVNTGVVSATGVGPFASARESKPGMPLVTYVRSVGIIVKLGRAGSATVTLFNMLGKSIATRSVDGASRVVLGERDIAAGLYVVKVNYAQSPESRVCLIMVP
jgi:hypothetical protein